MAQKTTVNLQEIYKTITDLALRLFREKSIYSRSDVAFELREKGIEYDSTFVEELILAAYELANTDEVRAAISSVFLNNQFTRSLVQEESVRYFLRNHLYDKAVISLEKKAAQAEVIIQQFSQDLNQLLVDAQNYIVEKQILSKISGANQIKKVEAEATSVLQSYTKIINGYRGTKQNIMELIEDYTLVRGEVINIYRSNVTQLTDIFGPTIKAVEPNLFDFSLVEWVDTKSMLKSIQFEFDNIINTCAVVVQQINQDFKSGVSNVLHAMGRGGNNKFALAMAGLEIFSSWTESATQTTKLKQSLELLKQKMTFDAANIEADLYRLTVINKTLGDRHIPAADTFRRYSDEVLTTELKSLLATFYQHKEIKGFKLQKDAFIETYRSLEESIQDHENEILNYSIAIKQSEDQLNEYKPLYLKAQNLRPSKPFFLFNLLTLGSLKRTYNRNVAEWYQNYRPIIESYNECQSDIRNDKEELKSHKKAIEAEKIELYAIYRKIEKQSRLIHKHIKLDSTIQSDLARHLVPLINLLRTARKVIELKIDEEYLTTVKIDKVEVDALPVVIEERLAQWTNSIRNDGEEYIQNKDFTQKMGFIENDEEHQQIKDKAVVILNNAIEFVEAAGTLKKMKVEGAIVKDIYAQELKKLREKFKACFIEEENKANVLRDIIKTVKTGSGIEVRDALIDLIDENDSDWATEKEIVDKLKSNRDIII